jgi:hypothetical protein
MIEMLLLFILSNLDCIVKLFCFIIFRMKLLSMHLLIDSNGFYIEKENSETWIDEGLISVCENQWAGILKEKESEKSRTRVVCFVFVTSGLTDGYEGESCNLHQCQFTVDPPV